jgi:hypothetical protein
MADSVNMLSAELAGLEALEARVAVLTLADEDRELLASLVRQHAANQYTAWLEERVRMVVHILFPVYSKTSSKNKPLVWPVKGWWWNGAKITDSHEHPNGDVQVALRSYVGGGDTDDLDSLVIPRAWVEAENMVDVVHAAIQAEQARLAKIAQDRDLAQAQHNLAAAAARLQSLTGGAHA